MATVNRDILRPYLDEYRKYLNRQKRGENVRQLSRSLSVLSVSLWLSFICVIALGVIGVAMALIYLRLTESAGAAAGAAAGTGDPLGDILDDYE